LVQKFVDLLQQLLQHWALAVHGELGPWLGKHAGVVVVPVGALVVVVTAVQLVAMTQLSVSPSGSGQQTWPAAQQTPLQHSLSQHPSWPVPLSGQWNGVSGAQHCPLKSHSRVLPLKLSNPQHSAAAPWQQRSNRALGQQTGFSEPEGQGKLNWSSK
jgi:hypothetical protein